LEANSDQTSIDFAEGEAGSEAVDKDQIDFSEQQEATISDVPVQVTIANSDHFESEIIVETVAVSATAEVHHPDPAPEAPTGQQKQETNDESV